MGSTHAAAPSALSFTDLESFRSDLLRFARLQLRDDALAEDIVQETFVAALDGMARFNGRAALKTWVFSILRNKIVDALRTRGRSVNVSALADEKASFDEVFDTLFKSNGHWLPDNRPTAWADPEESLAQQQFWAVFDACLNHLPPATRRVFMMREFLDLGIDEICRELAISSSNCYVILHRARHQLRGCLARNWFGTGEATC